MCGRFVQSQPASVYAEYFGVDSVVGEPLTPSFNVAPTEAIYAVAEHEPQRQLGSLRVGGSCLGSPRTGRWRLALSTRGSSTVNEKATFRDSFERRRCLIPADGF